MVLQHELGLGESVVQIPMIQVVYCQPDMFLVCNVGNTTQQIPIRFTGGNAGIPMFAEFRSRVSGIGTLNAFLNRNA